MKVVGNHAYVALYEAGLAVFDVRDPANCVRVGGIATSGRATGVAVSGNYACVADRDAGLQVMDVGNRANCVQVGGFYTGGLLRGMTLVADRIYLAASEQSLVVLPTLGNVQFTLSVDATPDLAAPTPWTPLLTTNVPAMPFDFVDFEVRLTNTPQKFYRVRQ